jgi:hypothetical protein
MIARASVSAKTGNVQAAQNAKESSAAFQRVAFGHG